MRDIARNSARHCQSFTAFRGTSGWVANSGILRSPFSMGMPLVFCLDQLIRRGQI
jgi:hypothetical protein